MNIYEFGSMCAAPSSDIFLDEYVYNVLTGRGSVLTSRFVRGDLTFYTLQQVYEGNRSQWVVYTDSIVFAKVPDLLSKVQLFDFISYAKDAEISFVVSSKAIESNDDFFILTESKADMFKLKMMA